MTATFTYTLILAAILVVKKLLDSSNDKNLKTFPWLVIGWLVIDYSLHDLTNNQSTNNQSLSQAAHIFRPLSIYVIFFDGLFQNHIVNQTNVSNPDSDERNGVIGIFKKLNGQ